MSKKYLLHSFCGACAAHKGKRLSNAEFQPSMNMSFANADEFFGRSVEEYRNWLVSNTREQLDFVVFDLIRLSKNTKVVCDCLLTVEQADLLSDPSRVVFMIKEPTDLVDDYCNRPDHQEFSDFIHSATDFESAKRTCDEMLHLLFKS